MVKDDRDGEPCEPGLTPFRVMGCQAAAVGLLGAVEKMWLQSMFGNGRLQMWISMDFLFLQSMQYCPKTVC